jgi:hypothetical protein
MITDQPLFLLPSNSQKGEIAHSFEDCLMMLDICPILISEWDKYLFDALIMEYSCYNILSLLKNSLGSTAHGDIAPHSRLLISNGSAGDGSMSFGWALSMLDGRILARCSGPAPGL